MKTRILQLAIFTLLALFSGNLFAQSENKKTEIQILGTPHLSQLKDFHPAMLEGLMNILDSKSFDVVCVEAMPAELLYDIRSRNDSAFSQVLSSFGGSRLFIADSVQSKLGISFLEAKKKFRMLTSKENLSDRERLSLIEYALASADPASATLNYIQLQEKSILEQSLLPQEYFDELQKNQMQTNEIYSLAVQLAAKQNLNKIELIDDFQDEALLFKFFPDFIQDYTKNQEAFKDIGKLPVFVKGDVLMKQSLETKDLLEYYRFINSEEYMSQDFEAQWEIWLKTNFESGSDRARYYLWEMRNLQIVSNIHRVIATNPGKNVLVIIGSSHKSFIEKYLGQVTDIEIMSFN
ncbi:MAG: DUF5694 domain-containing protein [Vicingaceae bacterium]|nr:DUF5694 domain-containing protein [Vicingaceae bacterium]